MPKYEYEYEALDASGQLVTSSVVYSNERQALDKLEEFGLHPTKLPLGQETPQAPVSQFWDGTFGDAFWALDIVSEIIVNWPGTSLKQLANNNANRGTEVHFFPYFFHT